MPLTTNDSTSPAVDFATSQIGRGESGANNSGDYVRMLHRGARRRGNWCAAFVAYCLEEVAAVPRLRDADRRGAKRLARVLATRYGHWVVEPARRGPVAHEVPRAGDVIAWHRRGGLDWRGHVELVESYDADTDTVVTIAGNVGRYPATVRRRRYFRGAWRERLYGVARVDP